MRRTILLSLLMFSLTVNAQEFFSTGDCKADFKYEFNPDVMTLVPGAAINFYDITEGNVTERYWDFGDGHTSTEQNPMFVFTYPLGSPNVKVNPYRTISLTIVSDSCKSTVSKTINIFEIADSTYQYCKAIFRYYELERDSISETVKIKFDNFSEGEELSYFWQFGNGSTSTEKEPVVDFNLTEKEYKVCLTVTSADSCSDIMCDAVYINPPVIIPNDPECSVTFGYEKEDLLMNPLPSMLVNFYYKSSTEVTEWYWDFGDGTTSNEPNPAHIYYQTAIADSVLSDSIYYLESNPFRTVCLTVKTANGCKVSTCETIQVIDYNPEPERCLVYFKYYQPDNIVTIPEVVPIRLVDVSEGDVISRFWRFEDGSVSTEKEPLVMFDIFQPVHKACLTVTFADSCTNTFCDYVYLNTGIIDTVVIVEPACPYYIKVDGGFPIELSSCAGWASARVYLNDSLVEPEIISWSTGDETPTVEGLCPTETYTVKALMPDGCAVWTNFILSADGTITPVSPINWWLSGERENLYVRSDAREGLKVEWRLCDGTIVEADSIPLDAINCGGDMSNMIVKDSLGNVVYSEMIALKGTATGIEVTKGPEVKLWPNPVSNKLNIRYAGKFQNDISVEICDIMGKLILKEIFYDISDGYEFSINTESLNSGIFILRISSEKEILLSKKISRQ